MVRRVLELIFALGLVLSYKLRFRVLSNGRFRYELVGRSNKLVRYSITSKYEIINISYLLFSKNILG